MRMVEGTARSMGVKVVGQACPRFSRMRADSISPRSPLWYNARR